MAVWIALAGTGTDMATKGFMAWFGPKGVATMTFSLFVLGRGRPAGERIFNLAALCVFASVLVHGLTDTPGWSGSPTRLGVKSGLLLGVREGPRRLTAALLAKHEAQLLRRAQAVGMVGAEGRRRARRAPARKQVLAKEAVVAADLLDPSRHSLPFVFTTSSTDRCP